jgi:hypothetical protein
VLLFYFAIALKLESGVNGFFELNALGKDSSFWRTCICLAILQVRQKLCDIMFYIGVAKCRN